MMLTADGVDLHVAVDGRMDAPPLLLLHGIIMSHRTWDWFLPDLVEDWRVHRLDFRGHGRSGRAPGTYLPTGFLGDAIAVAEHVGRPMAVVGHSLGGMVAAALAQHRPSLVRGVVMEDPGLLVADPHEEGNPLGESSLMSLFTILHRVIPRVQASGMTAEALAEGIAAAAGLDGRPNAETYHPDAFMAWAASQLDLDVEVLAPVISPEDPSTVEQAFDPSSAITMPGLLLAADLSSPDAIVFDRHLDQMRAVSPSVECRRITGAGHNMHDELHSRATFRSQVLSVLSAWTAAV